MCAWRQPSVPGLARAAGAGGRDAEGMVVSVVPPCQSTASDLGCERQVKQLRLGSVLFPLHS